METKAIIRKKRIKIKGRIATEKGGRNLIMEKFTKQLKAFTKLRDFLLQFFFFLTE